MGSHTQFSARSLKLAFGRKSEAAQRLIPALYDALPPDEPYMRRWQVVNHITRDMPVRKLAGFYHLPPDPDPIQVMFCVHTYYALVIKRLLAAFSGLPVTDWHALNDGDLFMAEGLKDPSPCPCYVWPTLQPESRLIAALDTLHIASGFAFDNPPPDALKTLYHDLFPADMRHKRGEYYTPDWLADYVLDQVGLRAGQRLLDPTCGSGSFLVLAARRLRATMAPVDVVDHLAGVDIQPQAVLAARANLILTLGADALRGRAYPIQRADILLQPPPLDPFDCVVGNPPWVNWETLPPAYRQSTRPLWEKYGLFTQGGMNTVLGTGRKDLAMLITYAAADTYLKPGGKLAFLVTQSTLKSGGASAGFRRFHTGQMSLGVLQVDDLSDVQPFPGSMARTVALVLQKGTATQFPVSYRVWQRRDGRRVIRSGTALQDVLEQTHRTTFVAEPIQPDDPTSAWLSGKPHALDAVRHMIGPSDYRAHAGVYTGGANGVYWLDYVGQVGADWRVRNRVDDAKKQVTSVDTVLEPDCIYPLLQGTHLKRWSAHPAAYILMVQDPVQRRGYDESWLAAAYPQTYAYLRQFEPMLRRRAAYRRYFSSQAPFYTMFDVGPHSFAPYKVVWQGIGLREMRAAVLSPVNGRPVMTNQAVQPFIGLDNADEAHFIAACLNSAPFEYAVLSHTQAGGKSFAQPGLLRTLRVPRYDPSLPLHTELVAHSRAAHAGQPAAAIEARLNTIAGVLWGFSRAQIDDVLSSLADLRR